MLAVTINDHAVWYPHECLRGTYEPGCTEPWVAELLTALLKANGLTTVLECGGYLGMTSAWFALTLEAMGGGSLTVAEWDAEVPERADAVQARLESLVVPHVEWRVVRDDACRVIASLASESIGFAFLDDDHTKAHVAEEIELLLPKMMPGGIVTGHDVFGSCDLRTEFAKFGGYAVDLPRLGLAGGLGVLQVP